MKPGLASSTRILLTAGLLATLLGAPARGETSTATARILQEYGRLPLAFEENRGQTDPRVKFLSRGRGYTLFMTPSEVVLRLGAVGAPIEEGLPEDTGGPADRGAWTVLRMSLVGAQGSPEMSGMDELPGRSHYFIGKDPAAWRTNVRSYARVRYREVYPGIDVVYYGNQGQLEYDFLLQPGADPGSIRLRFEGADELRLDETGNLILTTAAGELIERAPVVFQEVEGVRRIVAGRYVWHEASEVGFEVGSYDRQDRLVIDPVLHYSTYLGGNFSDQAWGIAVDGDGSAYLTGHTQSTDFPTLGPYQTDPDGIQLDAFVTKLSSDGSSLVYSTYLGGGSTDYGHDIAVDDLGNAYIGGYTESTDFPTEGPYQTHQGGWDVFVTKLSVDGSSLVYSTYLGGGGTDSTRGIALDEGGNAYLAGWTDSTGFPTLGPYQTYQGGYDVFVTKLSVDGSSLVYSTYLGGSGDENPNGIAVDEAGSAYVAGSTNSTNFPTQAPYQTDQGLTDAFVTKLSPSGDALVYSTYLGGSGNDYGDDIAVDEAGSAYALGTTQSTDFPTQGPFQTDSGGDDVFVSKLAPDGGSLSYSTYLGGSGKDDAESIAVDGAGSVYVTGFTDSTDFPLLNEYQGDQGGRDTFVTELSPAGDSLVYSTYLGGSGSEQARAIGIDGRGGTYVAGHTNSTDFPTLNPFQTFQAITDAFVTKLAGPVGLLVDIMSTENGSGAIQVAPPGGGCSNTPGAPESCEYWYEAGTEVTLTANPASDSVFGDWMHPDCTGIPGPCTVTMDVAQAVMAEFQGPKPLLLDILSTENGSGDVQVVPPDATCSNTPGAPETCEYWYKKGTVVTLTATPASDSVFGDWMHPACTGIPGPCTVTMDVAQGVMAEFQGPKPLLLDILSTENGSGDVQVVPPDATCSNTPGAPETCEYWYKKGTVVTLTATPASDSVFGDWMHPACTGIPGPCTVTMDVAQGVMAEFQGPKPLLLDIVSTENGSGDVQVVPPDATCSNTPGAPETCQYWYKKGTVVTLTATPASDSVFGDWMHPACTGIPGPCTVTMDVAQGVVADFRGPCLTLPTFGGLISASQAAGTDCGVDLVWGVATPACGTEVTYSVYRSGSSGFTPGASTRIASGVTGISYADTAGLAPGTTYYYIVRATDISNAQEDVNTIEHSATPASCTATAPDPVRFFAVTSHDGENVLNWANSVAGYGSTVIRYDTSGVPAGPSDGLPVGTGAFTGSPGSPGSHVHTPLSNGTTYYYGAFVDDGTGLYSTRKDSFGRPSDSPASVNWGYTTGASALAIVGVWPNTGYYVVSNDDTLHGLEPGVVGGAWPSGFMPLAMNAPAQGRPTVVKLRGTTVMGTGFIGLVASQDGRVYAFDAHTGARLWTSPVLGTLQGSASAMFKDYGDDYDLLMVGTREGSGDNALYALSLSDGSVAWSFDNGGSPNGIGIISGQVSIDVANNRVYFTSRQGGSSDTVWALSFTDTGASKLWSRDIGDVDGSAILAGGRVYVGTNAGEVYALDADDGTPLWASPYTPAVADGAVKDYVWPDVANGRLYFSTTGKVHAITDLGASAAAFWSSPVSVASASPPLLWAGKIYVGGDDSTVYAIDATSVTPTVSSVQVGDPDPPFEKVVGSPTYDIRTGLLLVGTDLGVIYAVKLPF